MPLLPTKPVCKCRLDDGRELFYDACSSQQNALSRAVFECIGRGVIVEIDGRPYCTGEQLYFYVYRTRIEQ